MGSSTGLTIQYLALALHIHTFGGKRAYCALEQESLRKRGEPEVLKRYEALPDSMKPEEVAEKITKFLTEVQATNVDVEDASASLCELADRQWHTYEYLDISLKAQLDNWVATTWNNLNLRAAHGLPDWLAKERLPIVENLTSAIVMFGLSQSYQIVKNSLADDMHADIKKEIQDTVVECGEAVDDPYKRLKQQTRNPDNH